MNFDTILIEHLIKASMLVISPTPAGVAERPAFYTPISQACFYAEAQKQALEPLKLLSVMKRENGRLGAFVRNGNGTYDIGPMQINTVHLPDISTRLGIPEAKVAQLLAYDGCFNVAAGAWLLRRRTNEANGDFWYGIGFYHSKTPEHRNKYIHDVHKTMTEIADTLNGSNYSKTRSQ